ncbi:MAG TPA: hypothetical protein VIE37_12450 [Methylomirabilota bacterium]|jgi:hypothetical protein
MTTRQIAPRDLAAEKLDAELRESEAKLEVFEAQAKAKKAKEQMAEISGLNVTRERIRRKLSELKQNAAEEIDAERFEVETLLRDLKVGIERLAQRYFAWDTAREDGFRARLDQAASDVKAWNAQEDQRKAERSMKRHDEIAKLKERIALGRARLAEWQHARHDRKAQESLEMAARHFDEAFDAAKSRYQH